MDSYRKSWANKSNISRGGNKNEKVKKYKGNEKDNKGNYNKYDIKHISTTNNK